MQEKNIKGKRRKIDKERDNKVERDRERLVNKWTNEYL